MKKIKLLSLLMIVILSIKSFAQNEKTPWAIGFGINTVDVSQFDAQKIGRLLQDGYRLNDVNIVPVISRLYVARYLNRSFTADFTGSFNRIDEVPSGNVDEENYFALDLGLRYDLNNLFGETGWFDPYAKFGFGVGWVDKDMFAAVTPSLGFNTWINESFGLNFETSLKTSQIFHEIDSSTDLNRAQYVGNYHFQHSVSLVYRFGMKDADGDGVVDKKDECPEIVGKIELKGCPDTDGDGIADKDDACPDLAGPVATNGCPDTDGDGVADKDDACPKIAGEFDGCPDTDGDGIADNKDECPVLFGAKEDAGCPDSDKDGLADNKDQCPNVYGAIENNGCAWIDTDGDGVTDNVDNCVNERGSKANKGCPVELTDQARIDLDKYGKRIKFNSGKSDFKPGVTKTLDIIAGLMKELEGVRFDVEGHSDSAGNDAKNLALSQRRAQAVVDYLGSHGIENWRLNAVGYGEVNPIASNKTATGRALNRRVVLNAISTK